MAHDSEKEKLRLEELYSGKANEELEDLAASADSLTDEAKGALQYELSRRKLDIPLQEATPDTRGAESAKIVTLRQFLTLQEALLAKSVLDSAGIQNYLIDENLVRLDWFLSIALGGIKIQVRETDAAAAAQLLDNEFPEPSDERDADEKGNE
ncbi:MAG: hypothetical protein WA211_07845 [Candidatus Acidiferrales bacterium]